MGSFGPKGGPSWVLECTIIADAAIATRTGSFMDGFATPTDCKIDGGNPWQTTQYQLTFDVFVHPDYDQQFSLLKYG